MMNLRRGGVGPNNDKRGFSWPPKEEERPNVWSEQANKKNKEEQKKNKQTQYKQIKNRGRKGRHCPHENMQLLL